MKAIVFSNDQMLELLLFFNWITSDQNYNDPNSNDGKFKNISIQPENY